MKLAHVLIVDTETSSGESDAVCIEVAALLYSVRFATTVCGFTSLVRAEANAVEHINRIPSAALPVAPDPAVVWPWFGALAQQADALVAHGADFDRKHVPAAVVGDRPWICSLDLEWPSAARPRMALVQLALAHDLGVSHAHRALTDCDLLARLFTRLAERGVDLDAFLTRGLRRKARFIVAEHGFDAKRNALAKGHGFLWDADRKQWHRTMFVDDAPSLPFAVVECADAPHVEAKAPRSTQSQLPLG